MSVVIEHSPDQSLGALIAFLSARGQAAEKHRAQAEQDFERLKQAAQQAQQPVFRGQSMGPPPVMQPPVPYGGAPDPNLAQAPMQPQMAPAEQQYTPAGRGGLRGGGNGGAAFLAAEANAAGNAAVADRRIAQVGIQQQGLNARTAANNFAALQKQYQADLGRQQLAEMTSALQQRNKLMQTAPGILDPQQISEAQRKIQANQDTLSYPARMARQELMKRIAMGDPEAIQEGVAQGVLAFSPEQQTRLRQIKEAQAATDIDRNLSPAQRAIAHRSLAEKLNSIRPMEVPSNEQPLSPQEQLQKDTIHDIDQVSGIPLKWHYEMRAGERKKVLDDDSKMHLDLWTKKEFEKWKIENGMHHEDMKAKSFDRDLTSWKADEPKPPKIGDFKKFEKGVEGEPGAWVPDPEAYQKAYDDFKRERDEWKSRKPKTEREMATEYDPRVAASMDGMGMGGMTPPEEAGPPPTMDGMGMGGIELLPNAVPGEGRVEPLPNAIPGEAQIQLLSGMGMMPMPGNETMAPGPPQWYVDLPSGASYTAPDGTQRVKP